MGWDTDYRSTAEHDAEQRSAAEARQRAAMSHFERQLLGHIEAISGSLATLAENIHEPLLPPKPEPLKTLDLDDADIAAAAAELADRFPYLVSGPEFRWTEIVAIAVDAINRTRSAVAGGAASAEPVDRAGPGSARPGFHRVPNWLRELMRDFDDWLGEVSSDDERDREQLVDAYLEELLTSGDQPAE